MGEHQWGPEDHDGICACSRAGCLVRWWGSGRAWQARKGGRWALSPVPGCTGEADPTNCTHIERIGIISKWRCPRPALPRLVVCEHHATPDALRMVILVMDAEIKRLVPEASNG